MDIVSIDFESARVKEKYVCAYGLVKLIDNTIVDELYSLVRSPGGKIDWQTKAVHKIEEKDIINAKEFPEHLPAILDFIGDLPIIAHNAKSADITILASSLNYYDLSFNENPWLCTLEVARNNFKIDGGYGLENIANLFHFPFQRHNPLEDAKMTTILFRYLESELGEQYMTHGLFAPDFSFGREQRGCRQDQINFDLIVRDQSLSGICVCATGEFKKVSRGELEQLVIMLGGEVKKSVGRKTTVVVAGYDVLDGRVTAKYSKALERKEADDSFVILSEEEFFEKYIHLNQTGF